MPRAARKTTKTRTTAYDVAEHLRTPEEMAAYLDAWLDEAPDDAAGIAKALGDTARAKGMRPAAVARWNCARLAAPAFPCST